MNEPYLIAHKVRGQPAFDIAERMECPHCHGFDGYEQCHECDGLGYWWIIPTSGHRAYPWWSATLSEIEVSGHYFKPEFENMEYRTDYAIYQSVPDHYHLDAPARSRPSLVEALGLNKPKPPVAPIMRRI